MKKLISSSEVVESVHGEGGEWEVCAVAAADYDDSNSRVVVELESFLRKASTSGDGEIRRLPWLPGKSRVTEHVPREEASQVAHDVFASWVRKVRHSIPPEPFKVRLDKAVARTAFKLRQILVPVDFSGPSEVALRCATAFAARLGGKIALVHVIESRRVVGELSESDTGMTEISRRVEEELCNLASRCSLARRSGEPTLFDKVVVRTGRPSQQIGQAASELAGDLIVISTHGYTGLAYVLLGGTAERVIRHAPCSVLVVRRKDGRASEPKNILVPVDFSPASLIGLRYALGLARPFGARLTALHVIESLGPMVRLEVDVDAHKRKLREGVKLRLEELHLEVDEPAGAFDTLFREGTSYHEIVAIAQRGDFDLIIMASLGRTGLVDMLLGSTAERVVRHAPCPVLVVRERRESKSQTT